MMLDNLLVLHMDSPLGIGTNPYFSWILVSAEPNVVQTAYRLVVSLNGFIIWDTGRVESDASGFIIYEGEQLKSRGRYAWHVTAWDNRGGEAVAKSEFEMALLSTSDWSATWAESPLPRGLNRPGFGNQSPATLFRKEFVLGRGIKSARLYATCHGVYRLTINSQRPDDREFAPEHTVYAKHLCYQTYDVAVLLREGLNALGMYVGDGWYLGPRTKQVDAQIQPAHAVLFQLEIEYEGGRRELIASGDGVKAAHGPVRCSDLFAGEKYDANFRLPNWDAPGFDDSDWADAAHAEYGYANLVPQHGQPVRPVIVLPALRVYTSPKGERIVDFGQVLAGRVRMRVRAPSGAEITLDHFETPDAAGNYFNNVLDGPGEGTDQRDVYVSDGSDAVYEPLFTFHGFRYVRVTGLANVRAEDFTAVALSSESPDVGTFECSDQRLNRLYENTRWSQRGNMLSIPTDCPQREKAGWTGDILIYAATALLNADVTPFLSRWLMNLSAAQGDNGAVPITVPYYGFYKEFAERMARQCGNDGLVGSAGWGDAAVMVPWAMYQQTGNVAILRQQYDSMRAWCDYVINEAQSHRGNSNIPGSVDRLLWNTGFHFGEWLIPSLSTDGYDSEQFDWSIEVSRQYTAPIFGWQSVARLADAALLLGEDADAMGYREVADGMKRAIADGVMGAGGNMPAELMGAYVLPIYFGLVPERHQRRFADKLTAMIEANGGCLDTGFLGTPYILDALCMIGRRDLAYRLLYQDKCPSWLNQVELGATTIWESWYAFKPDGEPIPMSLNHYAFGCVDDWMFRNIAGIDKLEPGFKRILIRPRPDDSLTYARRSFMSEHGEIMCAWQRADGEFRMEVKIPCNTSASIVLPDGERHDVGSGNYKFACRDACEGR